MFHSPLFNSRPRQLLSQNPFASVTALSDSRATLCFALCFLFVHRCSCCLWAQINRPCGWCSFSCCLFQSELLSSSSFWISSPPFSLQHIPIVGSIFGDSFYDQQLTSRQTNALSHQVTQNTQTTARVFDVFAKPLTLHHICSSLVCSWSSSTWSRTPSAPAAFTTSAPPSTTHRRPWWASLAAAYRTLSSSATLATATSPISSSQVATRVKPLLTSTSTLFHLYWVWPWAHGNMYILLTSQKVIVTIISLTSWIFLAPFKVHKAA